MLCGENDFKQFAVVRPANDGVPNIRQLYPARAFFHGLDPLPLEVAFEPALELIDELELHIVVVALAELL